jgi:hypothetical protein
VEHTAPCSGYEHLQDWAFTYAEEEMIRGIVERMRRQPESKGKGEERRRKERK